MIRMMINDGDGNDGDHNDKDYDHTNNVDYDHYHKEGASVGTQSHLASREARACGIVAMIVIVKRTTTSTYNSWFPVHNALVAVTSELLQLSLPLHQCIAMCSAKAG